MSSSHIPTGFQTITPYLSLKDAAGFVTFCEQAFGAELLRSAKDESGTLNHTEIRIAGAILELAEVRPGKQPTRMAFHVFVPDADAAYARAVSAGATSTYPVATHPYGERSGGVVDAWGNDWYLATQVDAAARAE